MTEKWQQLFVGEGGKKKHHSPLNWRRKYLTVLKLKNTMNQFLETNLKNLKASKTVRIQNNDDIKSVNVRHLQTTSNLLKPITQWNVISQKLKAIEKPGIFDIFDVKYLPTNNLIQKKIEFIDINIDELFDVQNSQLWIMWTYQRSGWTINPTTQN